MLTAKRYWLTLEARVAEANPCAEVSGWPGDAEAEPRAIVARGVFSTRGGERRCRIPDAAAWRGEVLAARDDPGWEPIGEALQSFGGPGGCLLIYGDSSAGW